MKLIEARNQFRTSLKGLHTVAECDYYFKMILSSLLDIDPISIALEPNLNLQSSQQSKLKSVLEDLLTEKPLQYILGEVPFRKLNLKVNSSVLIPRPETEELVGWILEDYTKLNHKVDLIDLGTGSGCIALSLKKEQSFFSVYALDIDQPILDLVQQNAEENKLEINCIKGDINDLHKLKLKVEVIVSNPPYITPKEKEEIKNNVLNFEPYQALFVPQDNPLLYYQKILEYAQENLQSKGRIYFEINPLFESEMEALIFSFDSYTITKRLDIFGKIRMLRLEKK
ncbi:MAG: Release factor glutamine methyltransferase [uncultured Bacteroidota bacterium]|nr:MAG: Release factor glutamine methyltransferase [uncultured Bacteroidetes bacterium]